MEDIEKDITKRRRIIIRRKREGKNMACSGA
jgi:hypothetical protein